MDTVEKYRRYVNTSALAGVEPITVERARGATVTATDGTEYTDLYSGIGVVNAGHVPPKVAEAAKRQMDKVVHSCSYVYHVPVVADLAERLAQITPGRLQKTFFGNSGAEAVEGALRLARAYTGGARSSHCRVLSTAGRRARSRSPATRCASTAVAHRSRGSRSRRRPIRIAAGCARGRARWRAPTLSRTSSATTRVTTLPRSSSSRSWERAASSRCPRDISAA